GYAGGTGEGRDEVLLPGNVPAMSALPEILAGVKEVIPADYRGRVVLRGDAHFGTAANLRGSPRSRSGRRRAAPRDLGSRRGSPPSRRPGSPAARSWRGRCPAGAPRRAPRLSPPRT